MDSILIQGPRTTTMLRNLKADRAAVISFENNMAVTLRALRLSLKFRYENWRMWMWMSAPSST
ncbi:hypothetical protein BC827DRAFT_1214881 [Russula dissimulans]|nr:hypothetical protein BC827DRAFT_1214881 [Russula dissimulans]